MYISSKTLSKLLLLVSYNVLAEELKSMGTNQRVFSPLKDNSDLSLNYSPIRKVVNAGQLMSANEDTFALETEDDARRSSTPTMCQVPEENSLHIDLSDMETKNVASRINNM